MPAIQTENEISRAEDRQPFIRTTLLPARPNRLTVGVAGKDELIGLYQVDIFYPAGTGAMSAFIDADTLVTAFPRTWTYTSGTSTLRVTQSWVETRGQISNWYSLAVSLSWSAVA